MQKLIYFYVFLFSTIAFSAVTDEIVDRTGMIVPEYGSYRVVHQDEVAILTPDSPYEYLVMGPLKPCQGIIITFGHSVLAYHRSSASSLMYLPLLVKDMLKKYGLESEEPRVLIYSAFLDDERFVTHYGKAYARHHGAVLSQREMLERVRDVLISSLDFEAKAVVIDVNRSLKVFNNRYAAEVIAVGKNGVVTMASLEDFKCDPVIERERSRLTLSAAFGGVDHVSKFYPPYVMASDLSEDIHAQLREFGAESWPTFRAACAHCERIACDQLSAPVASAAGLLTKLNQCARCKERKFCGRECQTKDWRAGHHNVCREKL